LAGSRPFAAIRATPAPRAAISGSAIGCYIEGTGVGPFESAFVRIDPSGKVYVACGAAPQGQGMETIFSQIVADLWKVKPDEIVLSFADTGIDRHRLRYDGEPQYRHRLRSNAPGKRKAAREGVRDRRQSAGMRRGRSRIARRRRPAWLACRAPR